MKPHLYIKEQLIEHERKILMLLFLISLLLKGTLAFYEYTKTGNVRTEYLYWAKEFASGSFTNPVETMQKMNVAPFIPFLIALFIKLFSEPAIPFIIYNVIVTSLVIPVLFLLGKEVFNRKVAWIIALWAVFFPEFFKYNVQFLKEPTLFLLFPLTILYLSKGFKTWNVPLIICSAIFVSILIHTDERFIIYVPFFVLLFLFKIQKPFKKRFEMIAIYAGLFILLLLPWGYRNYKVYNQVVLLSSRTTVLTSYFWGEDITSLTLSEEEAKEKMKIRYEESAKRFAKKHNVQPKDFSKKEARIRAFINFWQPTYVKPQYIAYGNRPQKWSLAHNLTGLLFYGIFLPFYLIGLIYFINKKHFWGIVLGFIPLIHSVMHAFLISPLERYRSPVTFIVVMIGIWTILEILKWVNKSILKA